ncbi:UBE3D [Bugula neritina]|uniref:E3 ubiquitin-protein ligase E3D n=1 Tax=Bugula neritina TaxID=10212 RepID=A0A7J7KQH4_BUGNE|nr:UBE3D [Bugula neritina]
MKKLLVELKCLLACSSCHVLNVGETNQRIQDQCESNSTEYCTSCATVAVTATTITYADCTSTITWDLSPLSHSLKLPTDKEKINTNCRKDIFLRYATHETEKGVNTAVSHRTSDLLTPILSSSEALLCGNCSQEILDLKKLTRILPLPSAGWADMADDWFCHQHSEECSVSHKNLLQPREGDLLVGHYSSLTHVSNLENIKIGAQLQIACTHCGNHLGGAQPTPSNCDITSTGDTNHAIDRVVELYHQRVRYRSPGGESCPIVSTEKRFSTNLLEYCRHAMTYQFVWIIEKDLQLLLGESDGSTQCINVVKVMYSKAADAGSNSMVEEWYKNNRVAVLSLPQISCTELLETLHQNSLALPSTMRQTGLMEVSFLQTV